MASRYWVGGGGSWTLSGTTHWSATSGGAAGATAPILTDDVFFDANSGVGTVTLGSSALRVNSFNTTGVSTSLVFDTFTQTVSIYGNLTLSANTTLASGVAGFNFKFLSSATGNTVTCSTSTPILQDLSFGDATGAVTTGGWSFSTSIVASNIYLYSGALNTNGQTVTVGGYFGDFQTTTFGTRSLTLGASTINVGTVAVTTSGSAVQVGQFTPMYRSATGMTFNAGTSTINIGSVTNNTGSTSIGLGAGSVGVPEATTFTYNNVNISGLQIEIHGTCTFANLSVTAAQYNTASSWTYPQKCTLYANSTVTGILTLQGSNASNQRLTVLSDSIGSPRTITTSNATASTKTLKWVNFQDITLTNSGSALGPLTLVGDCGGNTFPASTFDVAITCYAKLTVASCLLYTSPSPRDRTRSRMPSSA